MTSTCECQKQDVYFAENQRTDLCLCSTNVSVPNSNDRVDPSKLNIPPHKEEAPAPIDPSIDKWFYISGASA